MISFTLKSVDVHETSSLIVVATITEILQCNIYLNLKKKLRSDNSKAIFGLDRRRVQRE